MTQTKLRKKCDDNIKMNPVGTFLGIEDDDTNDSCPAAGFYWQFMKLPPFRQCFITSHQAAQLFLYDLFNDSVTTHSVEW